MEKKIYDVYHATTGELIARNVKTTPWNANLKYVLAAKSGNYSGPGAKDEPYWLEQYRNLDK